MCGLSVKPRHITVEVSYEHLPKMVRLTEAQNFDYRLITS